MFVLCVDLPAGQPVKLLVGFFNKGTNVFFVESMDAAFRYPQDYSFYIQNVCMTQIHTSLPLSAIVVLTVTDQLVFITIHHLITISVFTLSRRPGFRQAVRGLDFQEICSSTCMRARAEPAG